MQTTRLPVKDPDLDIKADQGRIIRSCSFAYDSLFEIMWQELLISNRKFLKEMFKNFVIPPKEVRVFEKKNY